MLIRCLLYLCRFIKDVDHSIDGMVLLCLFSLSIYRISTVLFTIIIFVAFSILFILSNSPLVRYLENIHINFGFQM